ncbi:MAG: hypothetical protein JSR78_15200 [Proteobacteria bacterium]|nr:hypothetical protein [Pseudomonadota bacterium]
MLRNDVDYGHPALNELATLSPAERGHYILLALENLARGSNAGLATWAKVLLIETARSSESFAIEASAALARTNRALH